jgi:hypothetical protein
MRFLSGNATPTTAGRSRGALSRRDFLHLTAAGGALAVAGTSLTSCSKKGASGGGGEGGVVDVTLKLPDWPFTAMPPKKDLKDPIKKAYADVLRDWLEKNPGVKLQQVQADIWNQQGLTTAVSGGTAPSYYPGNVLGGWNDAATKSAFVQGLAADVTDVLAQYKLDEKLAESAKPMWGTWKTNDRYFGFPQGYNVGNGIYYRRDLIKERGLEEPEPGWTWDDLRTLARGLTKGNQKGLAIQGGGMGWALDADGFGLLSQIPTPETNWNWSWDYTSRADRWQRAVEIYRAMAFEDGSTLSEISFGDGEVSQAFSQGRAAMMPNNAGWFLGDPDTANTPANLAKALDKPVNDVYGWIQHPVGHEGLFGNTYAFTLLLSFDPNMDETSLDKMVSLLDWMVFGEAYTRQKQAIWEATKELKKVYTDSTPINGLLQVDGVPGSIEDAWGSQYVQAVQAADKLPIVPSVSNYFPVEESPGPNATARDDAVNKWTYERKAPNVAADLQKAQDTRNKQADGFSSSISDEEFVTSARTYFDAHAKFWQEHAPTFAGEVYQQWYDEKVKPVLA